MIEGKLPLVSVIVPSYNHEQYIEETIESIINQTYKNIELIVIDDGSKDNSVQILLELSEKYNFILITRDNKGLSRTLNEGLDIATGEYISVCASDDIYLPNKISLQVEFMENNTQYIMGYGKKIALYTNNIKRKEINKNYTSGYIFNDLLMQNFNIPAVSAIYRKEVFQKVGRFDTSLAIEDYDMFLRIAKEFEIGFQNKYMYYYRAHEHNTVNNIELMESNINKILQKWLEDPNYKKAIIKKDLLYFKYLSPSRKIDALKKLPLSLSILKEKTFYVGIAKLFMPYIIYKIISKRI